MPDTSPRVALFVTCLVDLFRPSVGFAAVKLLEDAGCRVEVPEAQTCCGQPAFNSGDRDTAATLARNVIAAFRGFDYVVAPSGSCGGMIIKHYPELFEPDTADHEAAVDLASRTHELVSFLTRVMKVEKVDAEFPARATYHDSCSGLRELGIKAEPRKAAITLRARAAAVSRSPELNAGWPQQVCASGTSTRHPASSRSLTAAKPTDGRNRSTRQVTKRATRGDVSGMEPRGIHGGWVLPAPVNARKAFQITSSS